MHNAFAVPTFSKSFVSFAKTASDASGVALPRMANCTPIAPPGDDMILHAFHSIVNFVPSCWIMTKSRKNSFRPLLPVLVAREGSALAALACFCMSVASWAALIPENPDGEG